MNGTLTPPTRPPAWRMRGWCRPGASPTPPRGTQSQPATANGIRAAQLDSPKREKLAAVKIRLQPRDLKVDPADSGICPHHGRETVCALANHGHAVFEDRASEQRSLRLVLPQVGVAEPKEKQRSGKQRDDHHDQIRAGSRACCRIHRSASRLARRSRQQSRSRTTNSSRKSRKVTCVSIVCACGYRRFCSSAFC